MDKNKIYKLKEKLQDKINDVKCCLDLLIFDCSSENYKVLFDEYASEHEINKIMELRKEITYAKMDFEIIKEIEDAEMDRKFNSKKHIIIAK